MFMGFRHLASLRATEVQWCRVDNAHGRPSRGRLGAQSKGSMAHIAKTCPRGSRDQHLDWFPARQWPLDRDKRSQAAGATWGQPRNCFIAALTTVCPLRAQTLRAWLVSAKSSSGGWQRAANHRKSLPAPAPSW